MLFFFFLMFKSSLFEGSHLGQHFPLGFYKHQGYFPLFSGGGGGGGVRRDWEEARYHRWSDKTSYLNNNKSSEKEKSPEKKSIRLNYL